MNSRQQHFLMRITALAAVSLLCGCALASRDLALDDFAQPADKNTAPPVQESQDKQPAPTPAEKPPAEKPVPQQPPPTEKATPEELPPPAAETSTRGTTLREIEELVREHHPRLYSATAAISAAAGRARQVGRPPN